MCLALAGGFFTTEPAVKPTLKMNFKKRKKERNASHLNTERWGWLQLASRETFYILW